MQSWKKIVWPAVLIGAFLTVLFVLAKPGETDKAAKADNSKFTANLINLMAEEKSFDFGSISMAAGKVSHSFKIKNSGAEPVNISKIYTSCMCTEARLETSEDQTPFFGMPGHGFTPKINRLINGGDEAIIEVVFDPAAHGPAGVGPISRVVYLESGEETPFEIGFSAVVTP